MKISLKELMNDADAESLEGAFDLLDEEKAPGARRRVKNKVFAKMTGRKLRSPRKAWLIAAVAAVLVAAVLIPVAVVFANKAPEDVPAVLTETPNEKTEKTETTKEETPVEQTETPVETVTPVATETPVITEPTSKPVEYDYSPNPQIGWYYPPYVAQIDPVALIRVTKITNKTKERNFRNKPHTYFFVNFELVFSAGNIDEALTRKQKEPDVTTEEYLNSLDGIYFPQYFEDEIVEGAVLFCKIQNVGIALECRKIPRQSDYYVYVDYFLTFENDVLIMDKDHPFDPIGYLNEPFYYHDRVKQIKGDYEPEDRWLNDYLEDAPRYYIGNGSTLEEIREAYEWYAEFCEVYHEYYRKLIEMVFGPQ